MKFSSAVDALAKENEFLKKALIALSLAVSVLGVVVAFLYDKSPLVVERSSRGLEIVRVSKLMQTEPDIKEAIRLMLLARFSTDAVNSDLYLSRRQMDLRESEQKELKARGIAQGIVVRVVKIEKSKAVADFDRVLAVGEIRSALKTTVNLAFEEAQVSELNPYGLRLSAVSVLGKDGK